MDDAQTDSCLVTGGAGFIGSALVRHLIGNGRSVVNVDKLTYASSLLNCQPVEGSPLYRFHRIDVCDGPAMAELLRATSPQIVFHLAAETHVDRSIDGPAAFVQTNVVGTHTLLDVCRSYWTALPEQRRAEFRVVVVSTDEVYGSLGPEGEFTAESRYDPRSPYAASKAAGDHLARAYFHTYGLPIIVTNCGNNFGPYQFPEKLIPLTILNACEGRDLPVYGRGDNVRDWIHVDDHAAALDRVGDAGQHGKTYLIGANNQMRNIDVVQSVCSLLDELRPHSKPRGGHAQLIKFVEDRPGHDHRYAIDASAAHDELGWRAERTFKSTLRETVEWYLANQTWCESVNAVYRRERLGLKTGAN